MVKERHNVYHRAFKELSEIIKFFPGSEYRKIPKTFINFIEENMDDNYEYMVEHIDDFQNQKMLEETKILLSIVYRDFIASSEEHKQIIKMEKNELLQEEKRIREKYNPDNIFKQKGIGKEIIISSNTSLSKELIKISEPNCIQKIVKKIKNFFHMS